MAAGRSELQLSPDRIGLGCEMLGGTDWGPVDLEEAMLAVRSALEEGITVYDTADVYGLGLSEERLSRALGRSRFDVDIISKFGVRWKTSRGGRARTFKDSSPLWLRDALEGSLRRLRVERIPTYLLHWHDGFTPLAEVIEELRRQRDAGKIGRFGMSNIPVDALPELLAGGVEVFEYEGSLVESGVLARMQGLPERSRLHEVVYGVLHRGLLAGRFHESGVENALGPGDRRVSLPSFSPEGLEATRRTVQRVRTLSAELECDPAAIAVRWVLEKGVDTALVGVRSKAQLAGVLGALTIPPTRIDG